MTNSLAELTNSTLWRTTLAARPDDDSLGQRERLRAAFLLFRDHAATLASEIRRDLPHLTVHDVTHLDSLWEIASIIVGEEYSLTPTEGFVLGGAILLHDLAMSVAAIEGHAAILNDPRWADLITAQYRSAFGRDPTSAELLSPPSAIRDQVLFEILRLTHAENAEKLAFISYRSTDGSSLFLIDDTEIRHTFGEVIGRIAHSHWWGLNDVERQFSRVIGPPSWCPRHWTVDPLKLACILRTADAAHLDARRAPQFLKAIASLPPSSERHWRFQEKLAKPYLRQDSLVFTASQPFRMSDASAWWLCLETLRLVDRELRGVDALFADKGYPRFAARHVAGVDNPERLSSYIRTDGWLPVNAVVHVTDLPAVIKSLGGEALYGSQPRVPLRELIQNACDAVRARRVFEGRPRNFGSVTISLIDSGDYEYWLEVKDNGVGMSQRVLTEFLLDFGRSFWGSSQMQEEFPGLLATTFRSTGKYGIGFFSVFMISSSIQVLTRRADAAASDTLVLEFSSGLQGRPILRPAERRERLIDGGSTVRLKLKVDPRAVGGLLHDQSRTTSLTSLVQELAPAVDVDLLVVEFGSPEAIAITADDWKNIDGDVLLSRTGRITHDTAGPKEDFVELRARAGKNLRPLTDEQGRTFGRAALTAGYARYRLRNDVGGVVCVGGLRACGLTGIAGILVGEPVRASRDDAQPSVPADVLRRWAEEQVDLIPDLWPDPEDQAACAQYVRMCGGYTRTLPIAKNRGVWLSAEDIKQLATSLDAVVIITDLDVKFDLKLLSDLRLDDNVFAVAGYPGRPGLLQSRHSIDWPPGRFEGHFGSALVEGVIEVVAEAWEIPFKDLLPPPDSKWEEVRVGVDGHREIQIKAVKIDRLPPRSVAGRD